MKAWATIAALLLFSSASIPYLKYSRDLQSTSAGRQNYFVVDESIWPHARPGLDDLRLFAGENEVPYSVTTERGSSETERKQVRVLQPGKAGGKTQFFLDMAGLTEYDHIELDLAARDFVAKVRVEGQDDLHGLHWTVLADSILYDLTEDRLGGNTTIRLPLTAYKYLRVTLDGPVKPNEVTGASATIREEEKAVWREVGGSPSREQKGKDTVFTFTLPKNEPVEEVQFSIDPSQPNFRRDVEIENGRKQSLASDEITRVHMVRRSQKIDFERISFDLHGFAPETLSVVVHNGDDPPLKINSVRLMQYERRVYFTPPAENLRLYYGDEQLDSPVYDYAKLFQKDLKAVAAQLGSEQANSAYTGRPDERPWSERHPAVLWIAVIAAVLLLGLVAVRSMKSAAAAKPS